ncbi:MAG TPA: aminoacetone oxidase family FAD-binding enzyme, partial [Vicinamibacterales bacterium]|nr:aminoacetone oxidase family FAD-binding enzyme [Vicinamibacterales bacterium]
MLVIGAGAAGLLAAISAAGRGHEILLIERTTDGGRKILISGGGRCNVLPEALEPNRFVTDSSPAVVRRLLRSWPLEPQRAFFEQEVGVPLKFETEPRKYFPVSNRARDIRDGLIALAGRRGVQLKFDTRLDALSARTRGWTATTSRGPIEADRVILATGGRSVPATGSDGAGIELARMLGHRITPVYPALTPVISDPAVHASLSGMSLPVRVRARWRDHEAEAEGGFLFTHHGYSGPAILDVSHVAVRARLAGERATLRVRWCDLDERAWTAELQEARGLTLSAVARRLPARLAEQLLVEAGVPLDRRAADLRRDERVALVTRLATCDLRVTGDEGYKKAEVTGGGVRLDQIDPATMESRVAPGLFLC